MRRNHAFSKAVLLFTFSWLLASGLSAQTSRYVVRLKNKGATSFSIANPAPYLSARAVARRTRYNIAIDSSDLPVPLSYLEQIRQVPNVTVLNVSRWLNAIAIQTTDPAALATINAFPFVLNNTAVAGREAKRRQRQYEETEDELSALSSSRGEGIEADYFNYGSSSFNEIHLHNGEFLHNVGLRGQSMQIAMLDGGFFSYTTLKSFDSVNSNNQVLGTWDFVEQNTSVVEDNSHGMSCFSTIAANIPGQFIGKAPKASFYLYRTEDVASEYPIEEFNWTCGAERSDSAGADVISSSLGYGYQFNSPFADYPKTILNGDSTMSAIAADLAAKKGLLIFIAAGNSGNDYWKTIVTPSDADSVLAVGAVNTTGVVGSFSSYGPSPDGRIKPDVASIGVGALVQTASNTIGISNGTSFACPKMAGLGTCLWQGFPEFNNMRIIRAIREAGSIYASPNDRIGYGIPDMKKAFGSLLTDFATSSSSITACNATVSWTSKDVAAMRYEIERKTAADVNYVKVGEVMPAAGNLLGNHSYQFTNALTGLAAQTISYRIRQVIDTTAASLAAVYIDTTSIELLGSCTTTATTDPLEIGTSIAVIPNPSNGQVALVIETRYAIPNLPIVIYDMNGSQVLHLSQAKSPGKLVVPLPAEKLSRGKYFIKVFNGNKQIGSAELLRL